MSSGVSAVSQFEIWPSGSPLCQAGDDGDGLIGMVESERAHRGHFPVKESQIYRGAVTEMCLKIFS